MHYTKNYHLPQWEKSDRIMMDDFNAMCGNLEAGLEKTASDASKRSDQIQASAERPKLRIIGVDENEDFST